MKTAFYLLTTTLILAVSPSPCFALWDVLVVSKEQAKELGMDVRVKTAGPKRVQVELEFADDGKFKHFTGVDMALGKGDDLAVSASLREDRSKPGRIAVRFAAGAAQLDKLMLSVSVPYRDGGLGGIRYEIHMKDFAEPKKSR